MSKMLLILIWIVGVISPIYGQEVIVTNRAEKINGKTMSGSGTTLTGFSEAVRDFWINYLKDYGKVRQNGQKIKVMNPSIIDSTFHDKVIYGLFSSEQETSTTWLGIDEDEWSSETATDVLKEIEKMMEQFGVLYYRNEAQKKIDETQQVWDALEKQLLRLSKQVDALNKKLENNEIQKIKLNDALIKNDEEHTKLIEAIETNRLARDSVSVTLDQIKEIMVLRKEELRKIN